jgi:hypothetical protein
MERAGKFQGPLVYSKEPATGPYPEPDESSVHPDILVDLYPF